MLSATGVILKYNRKLVDSTSRDGRTALHIAAGNDRVEIASILISVWDVYYYKKRRDGQF